MKSKQKQRSSKLKQQQLSNKKLIFLPAGASFKQILLPNAAQLTVIKNIYGLHV